jgi:DNA mismatch repair protein MutL
MSESTISTSDDGFIHLLDPVIANKIAAGEVVQRPGSVVKELLDNAVDAGSDSIQVIIQHAGRSVIQVIDNGCGMSVADLKMCFVRHATSKISKVEDLFQIRTLGFRGEAMASIASVAQVVAKTKRHEDENGYELEIWGSEDRHIIPVACPNGTNIAVRNLFYNVPARRAFLKTDATEFRHILSIFQQAAMANPEINFELIADGESVYRLASSSLEDRVVALFGKSYRASLIPVDEGTSMVRVRGYLSDPKLAKRSRGEQFLFVNGRPFQHRYLSYTVLNTYSGWLADGEYPFFCIFLDLDPSVLDVNVHPAKMEVKFEDEKSVIQVVRSVVTRALHERFQVPLTDDLTGFMPTDHSDMMGGLGFTPSFEKGHMHQVGDIQQINIPSRLNFDRPPIPRDVTERMYGPLPSEEVPHDSKVKQRAYERDRGFWQLHSSYIVAQTRTGLSLIDQNRAHRRIIYERALQAAEESIPATQQLLFPVTINFSASDYVLLKDLLQPILDLGFDVSLLSGNTALLNGVPADIGAGDEHKLLENILQNYQELGSRLKVSERERLAMAFAWRTAIPKGKKLTPAEMESLVDQLFACNQPFMDPARKPTVVFMTLEELTQPFQGMA